MQNEKEHASRVRREAFDIDCANIRFLAACADRLDPENEGVSSNWRGIAETSEGVLYREIDFTHERATGVYIWTR